MLSGCVAASLLAQRLLFLAVFLALFLALPRGPRVFLAVLYLAFADAILLGVFEAIALVLGWRHVAGRLAFLLLLGRVLLALLLLATLRRVSARRHAGGILPQVAAGGGIRL